MKYIFYWVSYSRACPFFSHTLHFLFGHLSIFCNL